MSHNPFTMISIIYFLIILVIVIQTQLTHGLIDGKSDDESNYQPLHNRKLLMHGQASHSAITALLALKHHEKHNNTNGGTQLNEDIIQRLIANDKRIYDATYSRFEQLSDDEFEALMTLPEPKGPPHEVKDAMRNQRRLNRSFDGFCMYRIESDAGITSLLRTTFSSHVTNIQLIRRPLTIEFSGVAHLSKELGLIQFPHAVFLKRLVLDSMNLNWNHFAQFLSNPTLPQLNTLWIGFNKNEDLAKEIPQEIQQLIKDGLRQKMRIGRMVNINIPDYALEPLIEIMSDDDEPYGFPLWITGEHDVWKHDSTLFVETLRFL